MAVAATASAGSIFGHVGSVEDLRKELRHWVLQSPLSYMGKPCVTIAFVGYKGASKSTFINNLTSIVAGGPVNTQRCGAGAQGQGADGAGTVANTIIPLHRILFESDSPPGYLFVWDTVGLDMPQAGVIMTENVLNPILGRLVEGSLVEGSTSLTQNIAVADRRDWLPAQIVIACQRSNALTTTLTTNAVDAAEVSFLGVLQTILSGWSWGPQDPFIGVPLHAVITGADADFLATVAPGDGSDTYSSVAADPRVVAARLKVSTATRIPYPRCHMTFGLHTLIASGGGDLREIAVLSPIVDAVREFVIRDSMIVEQQLMKARRLGVAFRYAQPQRTTSLRFLNIAELAAFLEDQTASPLPDNVVVVAQPALTLRADAAACVRRAALCGGELLALSKDEIGKNFPNAVTARIMERLVAPHRKS